MLQTVRTLCGGSEGVLKNIFGVCQDKNGQLERVFVVIPRAAFGGLRLVPRARKDKQA